MKCLSTCIDVLHRPLILIISRCYFAEDGTEMYQYVKRTCKAVNRSYIVLRSCNSLSLPLPSSLLNVRIYDVFQQIQAIGQRNFTFNY